MAKIICPNKQYTGVSASVPFVNGVGETEDQHVIEWFKSHGYEVEEPDAAELELSIPNPIPNPIPDQDGEGKSEPELTVKEIKEQLDAKGIEYNPRAKKDELLALLK